MGYLFFHFAPPRAFFKWKIVVQIILYYHTTKQFQNIFWKNIWSWWKTYTKRCTNNYVIWRIKRLSSLALCGCSSAFNFRIWFGKQKNAVKANILMKNISLKIPILILFRFCLPCWLSSLSNVAASCFSYIGPCRWFSTVLDVFRLF